MSYRLRVSNYKKEINKTKKNYIQDNDFLDETIIN